MKRSLPFITILIICFSISVSAYNFQEVILEKNGVIYYEGQTGRTGVVSGDILNYSAAGLSYPFSQYYLPAPSGQVYTLFWNQNLCTQGWKILIGALEEVDEGRSYWYETNIPNTVNDYSTLDYTNGEIYYFEVHNDCDLSDPNSYQSFGTYPRIYISATGGNANDCQFLTSGLNCIAGTHEGISTLTVVEQPSNGPFYFGNQYRFHCYATGTGVDISYQWQYRTRTDSGSWGTWRNATAEGNATSDMYVTASSLREGYQYRCHITQGNKSINSNLVTFNYSYPSTETSIKVPAGYAIEIYTKDVTQFTLTSDKLGVPSYSNIARNSGQYIQNSSSESFDIDLINGVPIQWSVPDNIVTSIVKQSTAGVVTYECGKNKYVFISNPATYAYGSTVYSNGDIYVSPDIPVYFARLIPIQDNFLSQTLALNGQSYLLGKNTWVKGYYLDFYNGETDYVSPNINNESTYQNIIEDSDNAINEAQGFIERIKENSLKVTSTITSMYEWLPLPIRQIIIGGLSILIIIGLVLRFA